MLNSYSPPVDEQTSFRAANPAVSIPAAVPTVRSSLRKRLFDVLVALLVSLTLLIWLLPLIGLLIRLTSPGPAFFVQLRTGQGGKPFRCLKFRTMTYEPMATFRQATHNDVRVTPIGRFLRKTNLDELPQLLNVLLGDMSIVGPRPHPIQLDAQHWYAVAHYPGRYAIKPGLTGLAQVRGHRGETARQIDMMHRVRLDHFYIRRWSIWLDLHICLATAQAMVNGDKKAC
ncbi:hypothetical protein GCM10027578_05810 [Spirosoma luteolum]